jgi:hypothetical protein
VPVTVDIDEADRRHAVRVTVTAEDGRLVEARVPRMQRGHAEATFDELPPGAYRIDVTGLDAGSPLAPVSSDVLIWPAEAVAPARL